MLEDFKVVAGPGDEAALQTEVADGAFQARLGSLEFRSGRSHVGLDAADIGFHARDFPGYLTDLLFLLGCEPSFRGPCLALQISGARR